MLIRRVGPKQHSICFLIESVKRTLQIKFPETMPEGPDHPWNTGKSWQTDMKHGSFKQS